MGSSAIGSVSRAILAGALLLISLLLAGCSGAGTATAGPPSAGAPRAAQPVPETQRSIATAIALKASGSAGSPAAQFAPSGPRTAAEISASAPTSGLLDSVHLAAGKGCDACHGTLPAEGKPAPVTTTRCLSCHGGSYDAVAAKTAFLGSRNPHRAHTGKEDCDRCHHVHQPFELSCNACHTFPIPEKYAVAASSGSMPDRDPRPTGSATYKETED